MNRRWAQGSVLLAGSVAILILALWLRNPVLPYGGEQPDASGPSRSSSPVASAAEEAETRNRALASLRMGLAADERRLALDARRALDAPPPAPERFRFLSEVQRAPEQGIVLFEHDAPVAWAGQVVVDPSGASDGLSVSFSPFYITIRAAATKGIRRAVATAVVHAEPPADRLAKALDDKLEGRDHLVDYSFGPGADTTAGVPVITARGETLLRGDATPLPQEMVRFGQVATARARGILLFAAAVIVVLALAWRDRKLLAERLFAVAIAFIGVGLIPWSSFSNIAPAFDPTYYYLPIGGPFTANAGALFLASVLVVLAVYAVIRSRLVHPPRPVAAAAAITTAVGGPLLVAIVARGIAYPAWGSTATLWLTWEIPLFLTLFGFWLATVWLARLALGRRGTIHLRAAAAVAIIAGFTASAIAWRVTTAERLELAVQDIGGLQKPDNDAATLLRRFGAELSRYDSAGGRADLLKRYAVSDLTPADLPVALATWTDSAERTSELRLAPVQYDTALVARLVVAAHDSAAPVILQTLGVNGREVMMAVRHRLSGVTTAIVSPRTQLIAPDPFVSLLGFSESVRTDPPYTLNLTDAAPDRGALGRSIQWTRIANGMHGDQLIETSRGIARAHAEVDFRSVAARGERSILIVVLDAAIAGLLWALGAMAEGGFVRWLRARSVRWIRSYRGRLSLALSAFFVIPALTFAVWSYQRLRNDDRAVRELLLRETLGAVAAAADSSRIEGVVRPYNTPLFLYSSGILGTASDELLEELAPAGRTLPVPVYLSISRGELNASWEQEVGLSRILFGYRAATGPGQERYVVAAPARSDELTIDRRRRDLTILVLFATVMGAVAAVWLSGVAAKRLARDLELSRIEVARAERILAWGEMARQIAHEIKNPLTPIRLGVQHLRRARMDRRVDFDRVLDENVTRILAEIDRLDEIARSFSRYGSAPSELPAAEDIDVAAILRDVVALERMGVGGVTWSLAGAETPALAAARADELRDVLLNVFENARLARAKRVDVALIRLQKTIEIEISDDGLGIDQAALPRVFEPHFSTRTTGSGLGLAISRRLLESWGGRIEIVSEEGKGARVILRLQTAPAP
jgi:two-component system nitrogen regulation sensor histidine kinase NtrY